jgi:EAL domain-containing protein (putative c-di-GMP-specific phosphodiesterase class I)
MQVALMSDMRKGLTRGEFSLAYQAKASLREGGVVAAEALLRWMHPVHGEMSPDRFVRAAEDTGAIDELTRWTLKQAIGDQIALRGRGVDVKLSVNLSARNLTDADFCRDAIAVVREAGARIYFEITETAVVDDPLVAIASIAAFREAGISISIDDYGAGLSSLSYLKQIAADELKLDRSLISDLKTSARDRLIFKSTVDLAHGLGMVVVAEGVESEDVLALAASMGCDCVQGYVISRPLPLADFALLWRAHAGDAPLAARI